MAPLSPSPCAGGVRDRVKGFWVRSANSRDFWSQNKGPSGKKGTAEELCKKGTVSDSRTSRGQSHLRQKDEPFRRTPWSTAGDGAFLTLTLAPGRHFKAALYNSFSQASFSSEKVNAKPCRRDFMTWSGPENLSAPQRQEQ